MRHDLPGVGGNLQDHLQLRLVFKVQGAVTLNSAPAALLGKAAIGAAIRAVRAAGR